MGSTADGVGSGGGAAGAGGGGGGRASKSDLKPSKTGGLSGRRELSLFIRYSGTDKAPARLTPSLHS